MCAVFTDAETFRETRGPVLAALAVATTDTAEPVGASDVSAGAESTEPAIGRA